MLTDNSMWGDVTPSSMSSIVNAVNNTKSITHVEASCQQRELPHTITDLTNLRHLSLCGSAFLEYLPRRLDRFRELNVLQIDGNPHLTHIDVNFANLASITHLRITHNACIALPESVGDLVSLVELDVSYNQIRLLPPTINKLTRLQVMRAHCNKIIELPDMSKMQAVRVLNVSRNALIGLASTVCLMPIEELHLYDNKLSSLPTEISHLQMIDSLNLDNNRLTVLPDSICSLVGLSGLSCQHNILTRLPDAIGSMSSLLALRLSHNRLVALPESLTDISNLEILHVDNNRIAELPSQLGRLTQLTELIVSHNIVSTIPGSFACLQALRIFEIDGNPISTLSSQFGGFPKIESIYLVRSLLTSLPSTISGLTALTSLVIKGCNINTVPDSIALLSHLTTIDLSSNKLTELPGHFAFAELEYLYISENRITVLPDSLFQSTSMKVFHAFMNSLSSISHNIGMLTGLEELDVSFNMIKEVPASICRCLQLYSVNMADNLLTDFTPLTATPEISSINLCNNRILSIPESISDLNQLAFLHLDGNLLEELPTAMTRSASLEILTLSENQLTSLPRGMFALGHLSQLSLSRNQFQYLPRDLTRLDSNCVIDVSENMRLIGINSAFLSDRETPIPTIITSGCALVHNDKPPCIDLVRGDMYARVADDAYVVLRLEELALRAAVSHMPYLPAKALQLPGIGVDIAAAEERCCICYQLVFTEWLIVSYCRQRTVLQSLCCSVRCCHSLLRDVPSNSEGDADGGDDSDDGDDEEEA